ncbi:hypothetical protein ACPPVT_02635 [Angustibacter sp. McL0619]|uniref:hypothetical protein n=1 Tax=Angustibacter sp. McL0619 TaxID=3415676 RepID=UPI003CEF8023
MPDDPHLPLHFSRDEALRRGLSKHQVTSRVRSGAWTLLHRARYTETARLTALDPAEQHVVRAAALLADGPTGAAVSHLSAAAAFGWPLPLYGAGPPTLTLPSGAGPTRRRPRGIVQVAGLAERDVQPVRLHVDGEPVQLLCTAPPRTLADLLRHLPIADSVAVADAVLRRDEVSAAQLARTIAQQETWPYAARAALAASRIDPRRESWLESFSFCELAALGLPMAEPQVTIQDASGRFVARVDGWWDDVCVALEADGQGKYLADAPGAEAATDQRASAEQVATHVRQQLVAQNEREACLRELGVVVVRWSTYEIASRPAAVAARAARARGMGSRSRFTGRAIRHGAVPTLLNSDR